MIRVEAGDFHNLARRQRDADVRLRREIEQAATKAARPVNKEVAASARGHLPARLAAYVAAADVRVRPVTTHEGAGVDISTRRTNSRGRQVDLAGIDAGTAHHKAWGRGKGYAQGVRPGYWLEVMTGPLAKRAREALLEALDRTARGK